MVPHGGKMQPGVRSVSQQNPKQSRHWYAQTAHLEAAPRWPAGSATPAASAASGTKTKNVVLSVGQPWCQGEEGKPYSSGARVPRPPHLRKRGEGGPPRLQKGAASGVEIQPQCGPERCRTASKAMQSEIPKGGRWSRARESRS